MITEQAIRELATQHGDPAITTVYLDVDGRHRPVRADWEAAFERLADHVRHLADAGPTKRVVRSVDRDIARMRQALATDLDRSGMRGIAMFSCSEQGFFEAVRLPVAVRDEATVAPSPRIAPLVATLNAQDPVLIVLVDCERVRLLRMEFGEVTEVASTVDPVPRAVDTSIELGSWENHDAEAVRIRLRRAAELVVQTLHGRPAERLVVGGPAEAVAGLERHMPATVTAKIIGRVQVRVAASIHEIGDLARGVVAAAARQRQANAVEQLRQRAAEARGGVVGLEQTLKALADKRVAALFVSDGFSAPGARCPACGHLGLDVRQCPTCGTTNEEIADIVEAAVEAAVAQRATIEFCRETELDLFGSIGAIERY